jgi:mannose-6-phosphate isomerase-like protein (cupin superfamily)
MDVINEALTTDVVADLLDSVRVRTTIFCRSTLGAPWGFAVRTHGNPAFHIVTRGDCRLEVEGETPARLRTGDLVVLPRGPTHAVRDRAGSPTLWLENLLAAAPVDGHGRLRYGGDGATTELVCGWFVLEGDADAGPILRSLPPVLHVRAAGDDPAPWVSATLDLAAEITSSDAPGANVVLARVADTMLAQALRIALADLPRTVRDACTRSAIRRSRPRST